jgi:hypothetical protein
MGGSDMSTEISVKLPPQTELPLFDEVDDRTCLDAKASKQRDDSFFAKLMAGSYTRPETEKLTGERGLKRLLTWLDKGQLKPTKDAPGFAFLYDLLTGGIAIRLLPGDDNHNWGSLLLHLYPPEVRATGSRFLVGRARVRLRWSRCA